MDLEQSKTVHYVNLLHDAMMYKWDTDIFMGILKGIDAKYPDKEVG